MADGKDTKRGRAFKDITDHVFGLLRAKEVVGKTKHGSMIWKCECECGNEKLIPAGRLRRSKSCGCATSKIISNKAKTHGKSKTSEYKIWGHIVGRCCNESDSAYPRYGGRGIKICQRWRESFSAFLEDMGVRASANLSIERVDNERGYEPGNCVWATARQQSRNTRRTLFVVYRGERRRLIDLCEQLSLDRRLVWSRLKAGRSIEDALRPVRKMSRIVRRNQPL